MEFTYVFTSPNAIKPSWAKQNLSKANFEKAINMLPLNGPGDISAKVRGSAYFYSLITDNRMQ